MENIIFLIMGITLIVAIINIFTNLLNKFEKYIFIAFISNSFVFMGYVFYIVFIEVNILQFLK